MAGLFENLAMPNGAAGYGSLLAKLAAMAGGPAGVAAPIGNMIGNGFMQAMKPSFNDRWNALGPQANMQAQPGPSFDQRAGSMFPQSQPPLDLNPTPEGIAGALPPNAASTMGGPVPGQGAPQAADTSALYNLAPGLLAFSGATLSGGIGRGLSALSQAQSQQQALQRPTWGVIGQNPVTGAPEYGWINANNQTVRPASPSGGAGGPGGNLSSAAGLTGDALMEAVRKEQPGIANRMQAIVDGREALPPAGSRAPQAQMLLNLMAAYDPNFTQQLSQQRQKTYNDFYGGGTSQKQVKNIHQFVGHANDLADSVDKVGNTGAPFYNKLMNEFVDPALGKATGFNPMVTNAHALADELSGIFKGQGISDAEIKQWQQSFRANGSLPQQKEDLAKLVELGQQAMDAVEQKRQEGLGPQVAARMPPVIDPKTQQTLDRIKAWAGGGVPAAPASASPASAQMPRVGSVAEARKLPSGTHFIDPNGVERTVP